MACARPLSMWQVDGEWVMSEPLSSSSYPSQLVGCGQCAPCRQSKAAQWSTRLQQEGYCHAESICATLTYAPEHLPAHGSLVKSHITEFIKALRGRVATRGGSRFSFDACGEYSPELMRPHYHLGLFGYSPVTWDFYANSQSGNREYQAAELTEAWGRGLVTFQPWSAGAAGYCAGHQAWKLTGDLAVETLAVLDASGQVIARREPEFHLMSRRPGIGRRFFERYGEQMVKLGHTVADAKEAPVPAYYLRVAEHPGVVAGVSRPLLWPGPVAELRESRRAQAAAAAAELTPDRREVIEQCAEARLERTGRGGRGL